MKKVLRRWMMAFLLVSTVAVNTSKAQGSVSLQVFYDELQPYGNWMNYGSYGYVWIPNVDRDFTPYATNGYWINTEYGNTWVSDYSWGWAPFHYGRWLYDDFYGWIWVPDTVWGPAWVTWRSGGGYYGWAPLMPGLHVSMSFNYYNSIPHRYWNFVPCRYITYRTVHHHCVPRTQVVNIIHHTTIVTNNYNYNDGRRRSTYFTGPSRSEIERVNRTHVEVYKISDRNRPGRSDIERGTVSFYKPEIDNIQRGRTRPEPSHVIRDRHSDNRETIESRGNRNGDVHHDRSGENIDRIERRDENKPSERQRQFTEDDRDRKDFAPSQRTPSREQGNINREIETQRKHSSQDQQRQSRSQQYERQPENRTPQREHSTPNTERRSYDNTRQRSIERQPAQQQRSHQEPSVSRGSNQGSRSQPQRDQQFRQNSSTDRGTKSAPHQGGGSRGNSSKKRE